MEHDDSKQKETPEFLEVDSVIPDSIFSIEISGYFLASLQSALLKHSGKMGPTNVRAAMERFRSNDVNPENLDEHLLFLLVSLVGACEKAVVEQGKTKKQRFHSEKLFEAISSIIEG